MENVLAQALVAFLTIHFLKASSQDFNFDGWLNIDCGSEQPGVAGGNRSMPWSTDAGVTKTGFNKRLPARQALEELNTLRFFPDQTQENCYIVSVQYSGWAYIVRAGFLYGNYDNLSRPPTFDLKMDGQDWATVNTSSVDDGVPLYHETIYYVGSGYIMVCLVQTREGEVPFISSLETMIITERLYGEMVEPITNPHAAFHLVTRTNFAGPEIRYGGGYYGDYYNRIWTSGETPKNCVNFSTPPIDFDEIDNYPPIGVFNDSILAVNASDPIVLIVDLPPLDGPHSACFIFYFYNPNDTSGVRATQIYINGQMNSTITFAGPTSKVVTIYPIDVVGPTINITLSSDPKSTLSTLISGMEVFTKHDLAVPQPSNPVYYAPPPSAAAASELLIFMYHVLALTLSLVVVFY